MIVEIDKFKTLIAINTDGDEVEAPSTQDLYLKLRRAKSSGTSGKVPPRLRIESHRDALHRKIAAALDAGNKSCIAVN